MLITGCGHPGLERLVTRAKFLYGKQVVGMVGGLHHTNAATDELAAPTRSDWSVAKTTLQLTISPPSDPAQAISSHHLATHRQPRQRRAFDTRCTKGVAAEQQRCVRLDA